jgi:hypothetical protein
VESEDCRQVFLSALGDPANRVVGNGILGLYRLGMPQALGSILTMLSHADDGFRKTGIWLMGETGDLRFLHALARLMKGSDAALRPYVFRSFAKLKQKRSRLAALPALRLYALGGKDLVHLCPLSAAGQLLGGLKATQFALWENNDLVLDYQVRLVVEKEPLSIAFAIPRTTGAPGTKSLHERTLDAGLRLKRKLDAWMILQYCPSEAAEASGATEESSLELRFIVDAAAAESAFANRKPRADSARSLSHAVESLLAAMSRGRGRRHLILLDDGACEPPNPNRLEEFVKTAKLAEITIHGISRREAPWRSICDDTDGHWLRGPSDDSVPELLTSLYAHLIAHYQVRYRSEQAAQKPDPVELRIEAYTDQGLGETTVRV